MCTGGVHCAHCSLAALQCKHISYHGPLPGPCIGDTCKHRGLSIIQRKGNRSKPCVPMTQDHEDCLMRPHHPLPFHPIENCVCVCVYTAEPQLGPFRWFTGQNVWTRSLIVRDHVELYSPFQSLVCLLIPSHTHTSSSQTKSTRRNFNFCTVLHLFLIPCPMCHLAHMCVCDKPREHGKH